MFGQSLTLMDSKESGSMIYAIPLRLGCEDGVSILESSKSSGDGNPLPRWSVIHISTPEKRAAANNLVKVCGLGNRGKGIQPCEVVGKRVRYLSS